ncbi:hypothetical protein D3C73_771060 [compost metagenome]
MIRREFARKGEVYDSPAYRADTQIFQDVLGGQVGHVFGIDGHAQGCRGGHDGGGQVLAAGAVKQAGNEAATQFQIRHGELVQPLHCTELLRQPR